MAHHYPRLLLRTAVCIVALSAISSLSATAASRLIGTTHYSESTPGGPVVMLDSSVYLYPSTNTDLPNQQNGYTYVGSTLTLTGKNFFAYNAQGKTTQIDVEILNTTTSSFDKYSRATYTYDGAGNEITNLVQNWNVTGTTLVNSTRYTRTYDGANYQVFRKTEQWKTSTSSWITTGELTYYRDAQERLIGSVNRSYSSSTGNLISLDSNLYVYNAANGLMRATSYKWQLATSTYKPFSKDTTIFTTAGVDSVHFNYSWDTPTSSWKLNTKTSATRSTVGQGQQFTYLTEAWNTSSSAYTNSARDISIVNNFGQQVLSSIEYWDGTGWKLYYLTNNYYESYIGLGIAQSGANRGGATISMAPNPASSVVIATLSWATPQAATCSIVDMQGRVLKQHTLNAEKNINLEIPVDELPAGNYILSVKGINGNSSSRMFTVQH